MRLLRRRHQLLVVLMARLHEFCIANALDRKMTNVGAE
jgi:hypothetical protein